MKLFASISAIDAQPRNVSRNFIEQLLIEDFSTFEKIQVGYIHTLITDGNFPIGLLSKDKSTIIFSCDGPSLKPYQMPVMFSHSTQSAYIMSFAVPSGVLNTSNDKRGAVLEISENPVKDFLKISTTEKINNIDLYNSEGRLVKNFNTKITNLSGIPEGVYFINIITDTGVYNKKFIKK